MASECRITTIDNPFDPFEEFNSWFMYDIEKGYNTCAHLDRIARTSSQLSDEENDEEIERAIDEIIKFDFMNIYRKVRKGEWKPIQTETENVSNEVEQDNESEKKGA